jgi:hypothetical protein
MKLPGIKPRIDVSPLSKVWLEEKKLMTVNGLATLRALLRRCNQATSYAAITLPPGICLYIYHINLCWNDPLVIVGQLNINVNYRSSKVEHQS